jgi:prolyl-tRNA editing enzyme YbaK/EbsC (Cys-tRNA(Pro) deacylase)
MSDSSNEPGSEPGTEHASIARFRAELTARGGQGRIVVLPDSVHTAQLAADALGCEVGAIANSLLFTVPAESPAEETEGEPLLLLTSGAHRVDTDKVVADLGLPGLRRAKPEFVRRHTGQVIGGVSPFAHPAPVRTYLDPWLRRYDVIWAAAGHPAAVFSTTFEELQQMTGAEELAVE